MDAPSTHPPFPLGAFLGMAVDARGEGRATARLAIGPRHLNANGVVHGAVLFAMVDTAMASATMTVLPEGHACASIEVQVRFIRAASRGDLQADVEVLRRGRSVVHLEGRVRQADDRLVATAGGTFAVLVP